MSQKIRRKTFIFTIIILSVYILILSLNFEMAKNKGMLPLLFLFVGIGFEIIRIHSPFVKNTKVDFSGGMIIYIISAYILNPFYASLVAAISAITPKIHLIRKIPSIKYIFNFSQIGIATFVASYIMSKINSLTLSVISGIAIYLLLNHAFVSAVLTFETQESFFSNIKKLFLFLLPNLLFIFPSTLIILVLYKYIGFISFPLSIGLLISVQAGIYYRKLYEESKIESMIALLKSLEERDNYTYTHSKQVSEYSYKIAKKLGLKEPHCERIKTAALFHDIGKIGISDHILNKPGTLSDREFEIIKKHPVKSWELLKTIKRFEKHEALWVKFHHERMDGKGYPEGLRGNEIPLESRIIAVADIYDALTTDRPYRKALTPTEAIELMKNLAGKAVDSKIFSVFVNALKEEGKI
ncbi:MAG: HD-GYP domain-containing protein [Thermotogaceae bacterium]|nr:HD-GYP domain-containing protein [Thermotogaceae bacterium]